MVDANINRYQEGIRVVEDIFRYVYDNKDISSLLKRLRHVKLPIDYQLLIDSRDATNDVLRDSTKSEQNRADIFDIITANIKRAQQSARVLEEIFKLIDISTSEIFKQNRYALYDIEKRIIKDRDESSRT
ncbi:MAG: thiamine-phosphate pyrophosphorylase [Epsilonproteobacteria bacterium]|nr:thiamine-phosphate pyrophosphorylase [Campylobacterota bacterium]